MSRYLIFFLMVLPIAGYGILSAAVDYHTKKTSKKGAVISTILWVVILVGVAFSEPLYDFLFSTHLTESEPISLFDVVALVSVVGIISYSMNLRSKLDAISMQQTKLIQAISVVHEPKKIRTAQK